MKILVFSDIYEWVGYERVFDEVQPEVVVLAGDLTCDGGVSFLSPPQQLNARRKEHVDKFYHFLWHVGNKSKVIVIKGNHDGEFKGDFVPEKIGQINRCREISGKTIKVDGLLFLGLGYDETYYLSKLKPIIAEFTEKVDVVIMHGIRIQLISSLKPRLIIRGGYALGKYLIHNVPSVFNNTGFYSIIKLERKRVTEIRQYLLSSGKKVETGLSVLQRRYDWIKPYP
jgi:predicted phosphodiesterase